MAVGGLPTGPYDDPRAARNGLVVVINKFCQQDAPPVAAKSVKKPAPVISVVRR
jgi:hypothetical protein